MFRLAWAAAVSHPFTFFWRIGGKNAPGPSIRPCPAKTLPRRGGMKIAAGEARGNQPTTKLASWRDAVTVPSLSSLAQRPQPTPCEHAHGRLSHHRWIGAWGSININAGFGGSRGLQAHESTHAIRTALAAGLSIPGGAPPGPDFRCRGARPATNFVRAARERPPRRRWRYTEKR